VENCSCGVEYGSTCGNNGKKAGGVCWKSEAAAELVEERDASE